MRRLRAVLFWALVAVWTPPYALLLTLVRPLPLTLRYRVARRWTRVTIWLCRRILGIDYRVVGRENIPERPAVVLSKHQSAWETMALQLVFPPLAFVLKKELLRIPFFGWGLRAIPVVAIDRKAGMAALDQVVEQGRALLDAGLCVLVFPEGTRMEPGCTRRYLPGGAVLAARTGADVVPVALDAGEFWRKPALVKYPGTVTVSVGPPIRCDGLAPHEINARAAAWIEAEMRRISPHRYEPEPTSATA